MSWSVNAAGKIADVKAKLEVQFAYSLADPPAGLADEGELRTVRQISEAIAQCLGTFDPESMVAVSANGHMGFKDWQTKAGCYQNVRLDISVAS